MKMAMFAFFRDLDPTKNNLRRFGRIIFVCLLILGGIGFLRHKTYHTVLWPVGFLFLICSIFVPVILKPVYIIWMTVGHALGWINTRIIMSIIFYLVVTPIGLMARIFKKDFLSLKYDRKAVSYWIKKSDRQANYERTF